MTGILMFKGANGNLCLKWEPNIWSGGVAKGILDISGRMTNCFPPPPQRISKFDELSQSTSPLIRKLSKAEEKLRVRLTACLILFSYKLN